MHIYIYIHKSSSSVGIATRYRLDGLGIESWWRRYFPHPSRPALEPTQPPTQLAPVLSWLIRPEPGDDHTPHIASRLKEE